MGQFSEMEWNSKWDWENLVMCGAKSIESPKKLHLADWMIVDDGETDAGSFNLSAGFGNSGVSGSDSGCVYSAKSSVSASTDSSTKDGMQTPSFRLMSLEGFSENLGEKMNPSRTFPHMDSSIGSGEQSIGLKLGKRTYFNNSSGGGNLKNPSFPVISTPSTISVKKTKSSSPVLPRCVVEGCNFDLSTAKDYHRKHRVCESHAKYPKVVVGGLERRFCQQCSRFHSLDEFDEKKRSCRKRLSDHNARRRKPKQETVQFDSTRLSSPFYEGRQQQMSFLSNTASLINFRIPASAPWMSSYNSKFTLTKECLLKTNEDDEGTDTQMRMPGIKLPQFPNMQDNPTNGFSASKKSPLEVLPGSEGSLISSHVDAAGPECSRALSLLSTNLWGEPESIPIQKYTIPEENGNTLVTATTAAQSTMNTIPEAVLLSSSGLWHQSTHHLRIQSSSSSSSMAGTKSSSFQEMQLLKTPYEGDLFSNMLN